MTIDISKTNIGDRVVRRFDQKPGTVVKKKGIYVGVRFNDDDPDGPDEAFWWGPAEAWCQQLEPSVLDQFSDTIRFALTAAYEAGYAQATYVHKMTGSAMALAASKDAARNASAEATIEMWRLFYNLASKEN